MGWTSPGSSVVRWLVVCSIGSVAACGGSDPVTGPEDTPVPTSITLSPASVALTAVGDTLRVAVAVLDQRGAVMAEPVAWSSDDVGVVTVDAQGLVTARGFGTAAVTAVAGTVSRSIVAVVQNSVVAPSFATVVNEIFVRRGCTAGNCHGNGAGGLTLSATPATSYASLVGVPSSDAASILRVAPGSATSSYLVMKLEGNQVSGARMPIGGAPLSAADLKAIKDWINAGAPNN
jgi:hypothetical protein